MAEEAHDVAILAIKLQLHLGFVLLEIFCAHGNPSDRPVRRSARRALIRLSARTVSLI